MVSRISVAVVDDHPLYRQGVVQSFQSNERFEVAGEGATASDAIDLVTDCEPDLLFLDLHLPGGGLEAAETILAASGTTKIVVLSVVEDIKCVVQAFRIGVSGYLLKGISGSELIRSAESAAAGEPCVAPQLLGQLLDHLSGKTLPHDEAKAIGFAAREEQILALLAQGMSNKEIAYKLSICEKTAKYYLTNIMKKLNAKNRVEVALYAAQRTFKSAGVQY
jgi:two-component system nitrate/nitrite response regulator NarL